MLMNIAEKPIGDYLSMAEISGLLEISLKINSSLDLDKILDDTLKQLARIVNAKASSIWLIDESANQLYVASATGEKSEEIRKVRMEMGKGIVGMVVTTGEPILVSDARIVPEHARDVAKKVGFEATSMLCVSMRSRENIIGAIQVLNKSGGSDFDLKDMHHLDLFANLTGIAIDNARLYRLLHQENMDLRRELGGKKAFEFDDIIGKSLKLEEVKDISRRVAQTNSTILLRGESGTGKELVAQAIHCASPRAKGPFIAVNCGALPETLLESELFGHERGAFTNAIARREGRFELANGGTIFLDEVGDTPLSLQIKLLRVLETKKFERVGGTKVVESDVRVIAATNQNLEESMKEGKFRDDLYYRLNVIAIYLPHLRDRKEDIPLLTEYFLRKYNIETNRRIKGFTKDAMKIFIDYNWPGNIRELENAVEHAVVLCDSEFIRPSDLPLNVHIKDEGAIEHDGTLESAQRGFKKKYITRILQQTNGNRSKAAKKLQIQRTYLSRLIKELNIDA